MTPTLLQQSTTDSCQSSSRLSDLEFYSSLPCLELSPSSKSDDGQVPPSSPSSRRRKIFDFGNTSNEFPPQLRRRSESTPPSTPRSSLPILKRSSYQRLDDSSVPSLASLTTCGGDEQQHDSKHRKVVLFHPRVSSCEFQRSHEEARTMWWSSTEMQLFQIAAMAKVFGWGTNRRNDHDDSSKKTLFTHPALAA